MKINTCHHTGLYFLSLICLMTPLTAYAATGRPILGWGKLTTNAELNYTKSRQTTRQSNATDNVFDRQEFRERLHLRDQGLYFLDPRLISFNLGLSIALFQEKNNFSGQDGTESGRLYDYSLDSSLFSQKPYNILLHANRTQDRVVHNFGNRTNSTTTSRGGSISLHENSFLKDLGIPYFSNSLSLNRLTIEEDTFGNGQDFHRNEDHKIIQYNALKGYQTADLRLHYQFDDIKDSNLTDNGFRSHTANLNYGLDFGPTLNRRWNATMNYVRYSGLRNNSSLTTNQSLRIDHNVDLFSTYRYNFNRFNTSSGTTTTQTANLLVSKHWYKNLNLSLNGQSSQVNLPAGKTNSYGGGAGLNYHHHLPANGRLTVHASNNYRINDNNLSSGLIEIQDEPHSVVSTFPMALSTFFLNNRLVAETSIVIVDRRGGGQLATTAGIDYQIINEGDKTRIQLLPSSAIIQANDPLEVNYQYQVAPSIRSSTTLLNLGASLDFGWITFSMGHDSSHQTLLSGQDNGFLQDRSIYTADLQLRGRWKRLDGQAGFSYQLENDSNQKYTRWRFDQSATYAYIFGLALSANTSENFTNFAEPQQRNMNSYSANLALNGYTSGGWLVRLFSGIVIINDSDIENQTTRQAGITGSRQYGKLTIKGDLLFDQFDRGSSSTGDQRVDIHIVRNF